MPEPAFALRRLSPDDVPAIADLYARCRDYFLLEGGAPPTVDDAHVLFTDIPESKQAVDQAVFGWGQGGRLDAVAAVLSDYPVVGEWYLGVLLVDPARRGQGVGRTIYGMVEAWAVARGARHMRVAVLEANTAAHGFWRSLGFADLRTVAAERFGRKWHRRVELRRDLVGYASGTRV
ncbi:MAG: GNAT family N-acetyltransferase [Azospirillaceae bacterium]|nr:GNAT family N-acetyltransferase [Azospirillaceae bacterium]